jgi:CRISPR-associated protein Cmr2
MDWFDYFKAKTWALLHDPPNKMWVILGGGRCFEKAYLNGKAHVEEAASLWYNVGLTDPFGDLKDWQASIYYQLVDDTDRLAASMDRWLLGKLLGHEQDKNVFKYYRLHNIFNPKLSRELPMSIDCDAVKKFANTIQNLLDKVKDLGKLGCDRDCRARVAYHVLYALYEVEWIKHELPPSLADTRIPTHTVFDHNYATATLVNMLWPNRNIGGYLVEVDIPGIQRIVNSARKTGEFWAGSWLVSMLAWLTVWPLVWEYGPDIVVKPTLRLNPIYHVTLTRRLRQMNDSLGKDLLREFWHFYSNVVFKVSAPINEASLLSSPIIPGTIILLLPTEAASNENDLRNAILKYFDNAQKCLVEWALGESLSEDCGGVREILEVKHGVQHPFLNFANKIYAQLRDAKVFDELIQVRVNAVNLGSLYDSLRTCIQRYLGGSVGSLTACFDEEVARNLKKIEAFLGTVKQLNINEPDELSKYLIFDVGLAVLNVEARRRGRKALIMGKAWFAYDTNNQIISKPVIPDKSSNKVIDPYGEYVFHGRSNTGYIYCSVCGNEPAILHLRRNPGNPNDYDDETKNLLKNLGITNPNDLLTYIKPGEALGPLCLLKRALYYRFKVVYGAPIFDSTEDVAFAWYIKAYGKLGQLAQTRDECKQFYNYLNSDGKDITILCGNEPECTLEKARREFDECADKILSNYINEFLNMLMTDIKVANKYGLDKLRPDPSITHYRSYYAIIRGDADNAGKLSRGEIDLDSYVSLLEQLKQFSDPATPVKAYNELINIINGLIKEKVGLVVTPTYYTTLSMALMITALKDVFTTNFKYYATPITGLIFSGGDDILALAPTEVAVSMIKDLRSNYWGDEDGFHRIKNYYIAAPRAYGFGRSFSLRFANIMDIMSEEVRETFELLEGVAKKTTWTLNGKELSKDTLVISESRTGKFAVLPLSDPSRNEVLGIPDVLNELFVLRLSGALSGNVPEDYGGYRDIMETLINSCNKQMMNDVWNHVIWRNTKITELRESIKANLSITTLGQVYNIDPCGKTVIKEGEEAADRSGESRGTNIINELVRAYEVLRGYP